MAIGSGRGRRLKASWERVFGCGVGASIPRKIRLDLASIWSQRDPDFRRDFRPIAPRLGRDRASIMTLVLRRLLADRWKTNPHRSCARISSIAARSRCDRGSIGLRSCSSAMFHRRPMKRQKNGRLDHDEAASLFDDDSTLLASPRGVR